MAPPLPHQRPIKRLLIANRGEIATRILQTTHELSIPTLPLTTSLDKTHTLTLPSSSSPPSSSSTSSFPHHQTITLPSPSSYLSIPDLLVLASEHAVTHIHPGYGFLSESSEFSSQARSKYNIHVIGPGPENLERTGDKLLARKLAVKNSVPVLPALENLTSDISLLRNFAKEVGYPVIIKATDGGGGRGIRLVNHEKDPETLCKRAIGESVSGKVFAEKAAVGGYRHVEVQIIGDGSGDVMCLGERECSVQRRLQKVVEFAPASEGLGRELVGRVKESAVRMAESVGWEGVGTWEFLVRGGGRDGKGEFWFLEINPRLQVEHTVTECSSGRGLDLVELQLRVAQGESLSEIEMLDCFRKESVEMVPPMCAVQWRVTAEDAGSDFSLSVGKISGFRFPAGNGVRVDTHLVPSQQNVVGTDFDSLLAKIIVSAGSWESVVRKSRRALTETYIEGVKTNLDVLRGIVACEAFLKQECDTRWLEKNLTEILKDGRRISEDLKKGMPRLTSTSNTPAAGSSSNVLFRKGDAWSIALTPDSSPDSKNEARPASSHLELSRVLRNEFPASLKASILYTGPSSKEPISYTLDLSSTASSAAALASSAIHRRGDPGNGNHIIIPFAGKLMELLVDEGDEVVKGQTVAIVRQMKMELEVRASRGGKVIWMYEGGEGDDVGEGVLVVELEGGRSKL